MVKIELKKWKQEEVKIPYKGNKIGITLFKKSRHLGME